jgi:hypothetical protein
MVVVRGRLSDLVRVASYLLLYSANLSIIPSIHPVLTGKTLFLVEEMFSCLIIYDDH